MDLDLDARMHGLLVNGELEALALDVSVGPTKGSRAKVYYSTNITSITPGESQASPTGPINRMSLSLGYWFQLFGHP